MRVALGKGMTAIKYGNQGDAISREVPREALALIDDGGNGSERREYCHVGTSFYLFGHRTSPFASFTGICGLLWRPG